MKGVPFNKEAEYAQIQEKVQELKMLCKKENIPFFFAAAISEDGNDTNYDIEMLSAEICEVHLSKNFLPKFVNITLGFDAVPSSTTFEIDMNSL